jgi:DNA-binding transcriptional regulator GbsR (MarR family)
VVHSHAVLLPDSNGSNGVHKMTKEVEQALNLIEEIKEDLAELKEEMLSDKDYYDLRGDNIEFLSGIKK